MARRIRPAPAFTDDDYRHAIAALADARLQLQSTRRGVPQSGCILCGDPGHLADRCPRNPLVMARQPSLDAIATGRLGGIARAERMTPEARSAQASRAARARWTK